MKDIVKEITAYHEGTVALWHREDPSVEKGDIWEFIGQNHRNNFLLWHEEDIARRDDLGHDRVYLAKRSIDQYNQKRNNFMEKIDASFIELLQPLQTVERFHSETPGMIIDRLSILSLKAYHMKEEVDRKDASEEHVLKCKERYSLIINQKEDLSLALEQLISDISAGKRSFRVYFQCKMYNDSSLNPQLRASSARK